MAEPVHASSDRIADFERSFLKAMSALKTSKLIEQSELATVVGLLQAAEAHHQPASHQPELASLSSRLHANSTTILPFLFDLLKKVPSQHISHPSIARAATVRLARWTRGHR